MAANINKTEDYVVKKNSALSTDQQIIYENRQQQPVLKNHFLQKIL